MESILIYPKNEEQLETIKDFLNNLNVPFDSQPAELPAHVLNSIKKGLTEFESNKVITLKEFKRKHFLRNEL